MPQPIRVTDKSDPDTRQELSDKVRRNELHMRAGRDDERLRQAAQTVADLTDTHAPQAGTDALLTYLAGHYDVAVEVLE